MVSLVASTVRLSGLGWIALDNVTETGWVWEAGSIHTSGWDGQHGGDPAAAWLRPKGRAGILTSLEGLRRMSPTPPPLRSPWFMTVTIHISRVSQARSVLSSSSSSVGGQYAQTGTAHSVLSHPILQVSQPYLLGSQAPIPPRHSLSCPHYMCP